MNGPALARIATIAFPAFLTLCHPAAADPDNDRQVCWSKDAAPGPRVAACSGLIDAKAVQGHELAVTYCNRGHGLTEQRELDRALADYREVIRLAPEDARGWRNRGLIYLFKEDYARGIVDYTQALRFDPTDVFSWNNRGQARMRNGDRAGAIADFKKALELRPDLETARDALRRLGVAR